MEAEGRENHTAAISAPVFIDIINCSSLSIENTNLIVPEKMVE